MKNENITLLMNLSFKTICYRKNFDLITENENIITEYNGNISQLRILENKRPLIIGEFGYSVWNIELGKLLDVKIDKIINDYALEDTYSELKLLIEKNQFNLNDYKKVVLLHSFVLKENYRKHEVTEEFVESIYRDFHNDDTAIIVLVKPFQNNLIDNDYYLNHKSISMLKQIGDDEMLEKIPASEYYTLFNLYKKNDDEFNELKLFSIASRCGFNRIGDSHLFKFTPNKTIKRLISKNNTIKNLYNVQKKH